MTEEEIKQKNLLADRRGAITPSSLSSVAPIPITTTPAEDLTSLDNIIGGASQSIQSYTDAQALETKARADVDKNISSQSSLSDMLLGKTADVQAANVSSGFNDATKQLSDLNAQAKSLFREAQAIPLQTQQRNINTGATDLGVAPQNASALRENALKALSLAQQADIATANYSAAKDKAEQIISLKYDPLERQLFTLQNQLTLLDKYSLTPAENKRKEVQTNLLNERSRLLAEKKAKETADAAQVVKTQEGINTISLKLSENGINPNIIRGAKTVEEAIRLAGVSLRDPKDKLVLEKLRLDNLKTIRETELLGTPTATERKAEATALASKAGLIGAMQSKLELIDIIKTSSGLNQRVGSNIQSRIPAGFWGGVGKFATVVGIPSLITGALAEASGSGQSFAGAVKSLTSQEFLDKLIAVKAQGATFGALTDKEGDALREAATKINFWEVKNDKNIGIGIWNIDEKSFSTEIARIELLSRKAAGTALLPNEQALLDATFGGGEADPAVFFN